MEYVAKKHAGTVNFQYYAFQWSAYIENRTKLPGNGFPSV